MAVISPYKSVYAEGSSSLSFTPPSGRAAIVFDVAVVASSALFATLKSANATVGYFECGGPERNHLALSPCDDCARSTLLSLRDKGLPVEFPVPEGEKFVVSLSDTADYIIVRYREVDPGDVKPDMPNAKAGKECLRVFYGTNSSDITSSGWVKLDKSLNPPEMHNWPFEEVANPFETVEVHAIGVLDVEKNAYPSGSDAYARTKRVRIWKGTEILFHPNEDGFVCLGDGADAGSENTSFAGGTNEVPYAGSSLNSRLFFLPEPVIFNKGEEMAVEVEVECDTDAKIDAESLRAAIFAKVVRGS